MGTTRRLNNLKGVTRYGELRPHRITVVQFLAGLQRAWRRGDVRMHTEGTALLIGQLLLAPDRGSEAWPIVCEYARNNSTLGMDGVVLSLAAAAQTRGGPEATTVMSTLEVMVRARGRRRLPVRRRASLFSIQVLDLHRGTISILPDDQRNIVLSPSSVVEMSRVGIGPAVRSAGPGWVLEGLPEQDRLANAKLSALLDACESNYKLIYGLWGAVVGATLVGGPTFGGAAAGGALGGLAAGDWMGSVLAGYFCPPPDPDNSGPSDYGSDTGDDAGTMTSDDSDDSDDEYGVTDTDDDQDAGDEDSDDEDSDDDDDDPPQSENDSDDEGMPGPDDPGDPHDPHARLMDSAVVANRIVLTLGLKTPTIELPTSILLVPSTLPSVVKKQSGEPV